MYNCLFPLSIVLLLLLFTIYDDDAFNLHGEGRNKAKSVADFSFSNGCIIHC